VRESVAIAMIWVGALVSLVAPIGSWISLSRITSAQRALTGERTKRRIAVLVHLQRGLVFAAIATAGLALLVLGLVVGNNVPLWAPALPAGLLVGQAATYMYSGWLLARWRRNE
jgi:hypothetical protein